ncbi:MAG: alpha/beta hydrolase [Gemmatimonadota bacterium]
MNADGAGGELGAARVAPPDPALHVVTRGKGDPPLVLVHGFGAHGHFWRHWRPWLESRHRTHTLDLLGAGLSPAPPAADYSPAAQASRVAALVRDLGGPAPVMIGHSLGAGVALLATLLLRDAGSSAAPRALVLVSGAVYPQRLPPYISLARIPGLRWLFLVAPPPRPLLRLGIRGIVRKKESVNAEQVEGYREPLRSLARRRALVRGAGQLDLEAGAALARRVPEVDLPTLLIWGAEDPVVPVAHAERLARELPDAELVLLPGIGHLPPEEDPERSVEPVLAFLSSLRSPRGDAPR